MRAVRPVTLLRSRVPGGSAGAQRCRCERYRRHGREGGCDVRARFSKGCRHAPTGDVSEFRVATIEAVMRLPSSSCSPGRRLRARTACSWRTGRPARRVAPCHRDGSPDHSYGTGLPGGFSVPAQLARVPIWFVMRDISGRWAPRAASERASGSPVPASPLAPLGAAYLAHPECGCTARWTAGALSRSSTSLVWVLSGVITGRECEVGPRVLRRTSRYTEGH